MAVKTFITGEKLTTSDTNAFLNNGGLVYIMSQTVGSAVSSVTVSNCFSSTYDNYKIVVNGGAATVYSNMQFQFAGVTTGYYGGAFGVNYSTNAFIGSGDSNAAAWTRVGWSDTNSLAANFDIINASLAKRKYCSGFATTAGANGYGMYFGETTNTAVQTSMVLSPASGTWTGGTITVYGYRKA